MNLDEETADRIRSIHKNLDGHRRTMDSLFVVVLYGVGILSFLTLIDIGVHIFGLVATVKG